MLGLDDQVGDPSRDGVNHHAPQVPTGSVATFDRCVDLEPRHFTHQSLPISAKMFSLATGEKQKKANAVTM